MPINKNYNCTNLSVYITRDASIRGYEVLFIDEYRDRGGIAIVLEKWLRERNLSLEHSGTNVLACMAVFAALWTNTWEQAGILTTYSRGKFQKLVEGQDIV